MDRWVNFRPQPAWVPFWRVFIGLLLGLAFFMRGAYGDVLSLDLFLAPVLLSAALFRRRGLVVVPLAGLGYFLGGLLCSGIDNRHILLNTMGQVVEWALLAGFSLVTLDGYGALRKLQARQKDDVELARRLQLALMQNRFELGSVTLLGRVQQSLAVGGDFYYFRPFGQKYVVFCLGDVMGKGISASLLMALVMGFMFEWGKKSPSPAFVLRKLNQRLMQWNPQQASFVTLFYAVYDEEAQKLSYANAGHPAGLLLRADGQLEELGGTGMPLGVLEENQWNERELNLGSGDRLLLYSDGILEARSPEGEDFGNARLERTWHQLGKLPLEEALTLLEERVKGFCQGKLGDDLALLVMERS